MALAFWGVPFADFLGALARLHPGWLGLMALVFLLQETFRAWRQVVLVRPLAPRFGMMDSLTVIFVSYLCIHVFPARLGEVVRPLMLHRLSGVGAGAAIGLVVAERVIDLVAALAMLLFVLLAADTDLVLRLGERSVRLATLGHTFGWAVVLPGLLGAVGMAALGERALGLFRALVDRLTAVVGGRALGLKLVGMAASFVEGFAVLRHAGRLGAVLALTVCTWATTGSIYWLLARGFHIDHLVGAVEAVAVMVVTMLAALLPAPPGMAGVQEAAGRAAVALFGVHGGDLDAVGLAYAVVVHWWQVIVQALGAAWLLRRAGTSVGELARASREGG